MTAPIRFFQARSSAAFDRAEAAVTLAGEAVSEGRRLRDLLGEGAERSNQLGVLKLAHDWYLRDARRASRSGSRWLRVAVVTTRLGGITTRLGRLACGLVCRAVIFLARKVSR